MAHATCAKRCRSGAAGRLFEKDAASSSRTSTVQKLAEDAAAGEAQDHGLERGEQHDDGPDPEVRRDVKGVRVDRVRAMALRRQHVRHRAFCGDEQDGGDGHDHERDVHVR